MRNNIKALLSFVLIISMMLPLSSCVLFKDPDKVPIDDGTNKEDVPYDIVEGKYFIYNGKTEYVILAPDDMSSGEQNAVSEMENFFEEAIGDDVEVYTESQELPDGKKYISIGDTKQAFDALGVEGKRLSQESFRIVTKNDDIYVIGQGNGVVYGVYQLLNYMFNYEFFRSDVYTLNKDVKELNFFEIDETQEPDIDFFPSLYHGLRSDAVNAMRYRHTNEWAIMVGKQYHNSFLVLDPAVYSTNHPSWYNESSTQLCYTAHGNEEELELMIQAAVEFYVNEFELAPTKTYAAFIMQDNRDWCYCDACTISAEKYGANSTAQLKMAHRIWEDVTEQLRARGDERNIKIVTMVYYECEDVPATWDEAQGKYVLTDPTLDFEGVVPFWAAMDLKEHEKSWTAPENSQAVTLLTQINDLFDEFWVWDYAVNFHDYMMPFNSFGTMSADFEFLSQFNIGYYLYQCDHDAGNTTGFGALKTYLVSKLRWDADLDIKKLTEDYFRAVYGNASVSMKKIYDEYMLLATLNAAGYTDAEGNEILPWDQSIYSSTITNKEYWSKPVLRGWLELIDESYAAIEPLKETDRDKYDIYEYNIRMESIFIRYLYAINYLDADTPENIQFKMELNNDVTGNFTRYGEGNRYIVDFAGIIGLPLD